MLYKNRGFTLLEIVIALFIFTIVSLIMTGSLHRIIATQERTEKNATHLRQLQMALLLFSRDIEQAIDRPVATPEGNLEEAFLGTKEGLTFTHLGFANPHGELQTSTMQRTRYRLEHNQLIRDSWMELDHIPQSLPHSRPLLDNLKEVYFRYLGQDKVFHSFWPPEAGKNDMVKLPHAVEIHIKLQQGSELTQIYLLPQQVPHEAS